MGKLIQVTAAQRGVVERQARANIGDGFTIPVHFPGEPTGSCTFSMRRGRSLPTRNLGMASWVGTSAFQAARAILRAARERPSAAVPKVRLTDRQVQCTLLVGRGLCEGEIATRLGISAETVKQHLKDARQAYGVAKSIQLVTHSLQDGRFSLRDLLAEKGSELH